MTPLSDRGLGDTTTLSSDWAISTGVVPNNPTPPAGLSATDVCLNNCDLANANNNDAALTCYAQCWTAGGIQMGPSPIPTGVLGLLAGALPGAPGSSGSLLIGAAIVFGVVMLAGKL
jgi:hypothetical protein